LTILTPGSPGLDDADFNEPPKVIAFPSPESVRKSNFRKILIELIYYLVALCIILTNLTRY
jgi:hypothetical protein